MARSRPDKRNQKRKKSKNATSSDLSPTMAQPLLEQATALLQTGCAEEALPVAKKSLRCLQSPEIQPVSQSPVLELIGEICIELGDPEEARKIFEEAAKLDPEALLPAEEGGGAEKFLWLAQLSEEGGADSLKWFEKGITVLRRELATADDPTDEVEAILIEEKKTKLANALCGAAELYMTDLSWDADAESRCESFVTEACLVSPDSPEPLQTLASVRISQNKLNDAQSALNRSLDMWTSLPPEHNDVPEFPTRISLARLLMEAGMEEKALEVLDRLVAEDDTSVEAWYLGGWCLNLLAAKTKVFDGVIAVGQDDAESEQMTLLTNSRKWLHQALKLYGTLEYEDDRLRDHAKEIIEELDEKLGPMPEGTADEEDEWEDSDVDDQDDDDEQMNGT